MKQVILAPKNLGWRGKCRPPGPICALLQYIKIDQIWAVCLWLPGSGPPSLDSAGPDWPSKFKQVWIYGVPIPGFWGPSIEFLKLYLIASHNNRQLVAISPRMIISEWRLAKINVTRTKRPQRGVKNKSIQWMWVHLTMYLVLSIHSAVTRKSRAFFCKKKLCNFEGKLKVASTQTYFT